MTLNNYRDREKHAFSLVELSIVLVILGLLAGGILTGQALIRAAELRSVTTEFSSYQTTVITFKDKYFALPGDMKNATDFWPSSTTNGNGDGSIGYHATTENFQFWKALEKAGLIGNTYSGVADADAASTIGENIPASRLSNAGWSAFTLFGKNTTFGGSCEMIRADYRNALAIGGYRQGWWPMMPVLNNHEAWNIDTKVDDGNPSYGNVIASRRGTVCFTATPTGGCEIYQDEVTEYDLDAGNQGCSLIFSNAF